MHVVDRASTAGASRLRYLDENAVGPARNSAPVIMLRHQGSVQHYGLKQADLICRTAVYQIRMHGGVERRGRGASSYPD